MIKKNLYIIVPVLAVIVSSFFLLTSLDDNIYDIFLRTIPSLTEDESVTIVKIDDPSIENVGVFPWSRDIMADAIVFMREMGAVTVAFDLSYLDKSPALYNSEFVKKGLPDAIDKNFNDIDQVVTYVMDSIENRDISPSEAPDYRDQILDYNESIKDNITSALENITYNVDAYFADTLRLFGDSYLTLSMVSPNDITGDNKTFDMSAYDTEWLEDVVALKNINPNGDTLTPEQIGIIPAIPELLKNSYGAGFVNANPDDDGLRRRVHLLMKYNGLYYGQLAFTALLKQFGDPEIVVNNNYITIKDALINNEKRDINIPRTEDGSVLIKWPKQEFKDYNQMSAWYLINNKNLESIFVTNLIEMGIKNGLFYYWDEQQTPIEIYNDSTYIKENLYEGESPDFGITIENYRQYKENFISAAGRFLNGGYEEKILADLGDNSENKVIVSEMFNTTRKRLDDLNSVRAKASKKMNEAFIIIGFDATSMTDVGQTTFQERFPNVGIYSAVSNMILSGEFLDDTSPIFSILIAIILSLTLGIYIHKYNTSRALTAGVLTIFITIVPILLFFIVTKIYIGVSVPLISVLITFISLVAINFLVTIKEKSFLRSAFSRYLSPEVISDIIEDPSKLNLGGEKREMTAIFTDIEKFSTISERLDPTDLVSLLNKYLTEMSNIVMDHRGTIDKYEGDAIIAFFGAPLHMDEHAKLACRTAIKMKEAEEELNKYVKENNLSHLPIYTRIGINTGDMVVGNMGTPNKMDYTIMGNSVNLAARLEGVNKQYNTGGILISEQTREQLGDEFLLRKLDRVRVVGVSTPIRLYELLKQMSDSSEQEIEDISVWDNAMELYDKQQYEEAKKLFKEINKDSQIDNIFTTFIKRCDDCLNKKFESWDGIFNLASK